MVLWQIFVAFARTGILGYGGGPSSIPLVQIEVVNNFKWLTLEEFSDILAIGNALPGPIATKMAGYVGYKVAGLPGAFMALLGTIGPSLLAMLLLYQALLSFKNLPYVQGMIRGIRPVVIVLLGILILDLWPAAMKGWQTAAIGIVAFVAIRLLHVHPALTVVGALLLGAFWLA
ncbi:MAG: chromate transporter [Bacillota bacterium]|nr:chromate transporter [Bacillota bacterium]